MNNEYLVPIYESNHTYDRVVYDTPDNETKTNGEVAAKAATYTPNTSSKFEVMYSKKDDVKLLKEQATKCCSPRFSRCLIVAGAITMIVCLILTLVNILLLMSMKSLQEKRLCCFRTDGAFPSNETWNWGPWGYCSAPCDYGMRSRERYCGNKSCGDAVLDKEICRERKCEESSPVGFSAALKTKLEDVSKGTTLVYKTVSFNSGEGYSNETGNFICPQSGVYLFVMFVQGLYSSKVGAAQQTSLVLKIDGKVYRSLVSEPVKGGHDETGGNAIVIPMKKGQKAWVETFYDDKQSIYIGRTTFSGVLIR